MLKNRYNEVLIGLNLTSLMRGLISRRRNRTTLLIDDPRFRAMSYPSLFISEMEINALLRVGNNFDIPELQNVRDFLTPAQLVFAMGHKRLALGKAPMENLKELLRKFPELLDSSDLDLVYAEDESYFNSSFLEELTRYEKLCFEASFRPKGFRFELQGPKWLKSVYSRFGELLNGEYRQTKSLQEKSLLHVLSLWSEEKLKTRMEPEDVPFYFFRLLSPAYRLQDLFISTQLKRRLSLLGGDFKESSVQFWQLHENKFENLLLESFEGVISGERVLFFSHLPEEVPFKVISPYGVFRKTQITPQKRASSPFPANKITFFTEESLLGSEKPFRTLIEHEEGAAGYHWPYPELPGSKSGFYKKDCWSMFEQDSQLFPFAMKEPVFQGVPGVTLDMRKVAENRKSEASVLGRLPLEVASGERVVQGFEYWGPFRYRSHGFLSLCYGVEGI